MTHDEKKKQYQKEYYARPEVKERIKKEMQEYYARPEVKEKRKQYQKEYYARPEVKERIKKQMQEYNARSEVKKKKKEYNVEYYARPGVREKAREQHKEYIARPEVKVKIEEHNARPEVKEKRKQYQKEYDARPEVKERYTHPEVKKKKKEYQRKLLQENLHHRIKLGISSRIRIALKQKGVAKSNSTIELLGCTIPQLKKHLESKFQPGMTWENHTSHGWHIDHIKPCAKFDLTKEEEQKKCFHYTNLQPLWAQDNLSKSDSYKE